jgi:hypothetical protein
MRPDSGAIERALVRSSVGALSARLDRCCHCHRTPLVGEAVYVYATGRHGEEIVCELCRPLRTAAPERSVLVRSPEQAASVRFVGART